MILFLTRYHLGSVYLNVLVSFFIYFCFIKLHFWDFSLFLVECAPVKGGPESTHSTISDSFSSAINNTELATPLISSQSSMSPPLESPINVPEVNSVFSDSQQLNKERGVQRRTSLHGMSCEAAYNEVHSKVHDYFLRYKSDPTGIMMSIASDVDASTIKGKGVRAKVILAYVHEYGALKPNQAPVDSSPSSCINCSGFCSGHVKNDTIYGSQENAVVKGEATGFCLIS